MQALRWGPAAPIPSHSPPPLPTPSWRQEFNRDSADEAEALSYAWDRECRLALRVAEDIVAGAPGTEHLLCTRGVYGRLRGSQVTLYEVMEASPATYGVPLPMPTGVWEPSIPALRTTYGESLGSGADVYSYMQARKIPRASERFAVAVTGQALMALRWLHGGHAGGETYVHRVRARCG